jgi:hypothetical protein
MLFALHAKMDITGMGDCFETARQGVSSFGDGWSVPGSNLNPPLIYLYLTIHQHW